MPIIPNLVRFPVSIPPMRRHQHRFLHLQRRTPCRILRQPLVSHHIPYRILRQPLVSCHIPLTFQGILTPVAMEMECHPAEVPEVAQEEDPVEVLVVALVHHFGHRSSLVEVVDPLVALVDMDHSVQEEAEFRTWCSWTSWFRPLLPPHQVPLQVLLLWVRSPVT